MPSDSQPHVPLGETSVKLIYLWVNRIETMHILGLIFDERANAIICFLEQNKLLFICQTYLTYIYHLNAIH